MIELKEIFLVESIDVQFRLECVGYHGEQKDMRIDAMLNDVRVGYLSYSVYQEQVAIQYVMVQSRYKQQGIARQMFEYLMREEDVAWDDIKHGGQTDEGSEMFERLNNRFHNPDFEGRMLKRNFTWTEISEIRWELIEKVEETQGIEIEHNEELCNDLENIIGNIRYKGKQDHESIIEFLLTKQDVQAKLKEME